MNRLRIILLLTITCMVGFVTNNAASHAQTTQVRGVPGLPIPPFPRRGRRPDPSGRIETFRPAGRISRADLPAFFQPLGANPRTCASCHTADQGFSLTAESAQATFTATNGTDPLFNPVDAATCPTDDVSTLDARNKAYKLLLNQGLIRIAAPLPSRLHFTVNAVSDPYACTSLGSSTTGILSLYRRPLPTTNLPFLTSITWDGREGSLAQDVIDEAIAHEQVAAPGPSADKQNQIVEFESSIFTAQVSDNEAGSLEAKPTRLTLTVPSGGSGPCGQTTLKQTGGAEALAALAKDFFPGINDPGGQNPCGTAFSDDVFDLYDAWGRFHGGSGGGERGGGGRRRTRESIARGQELFNTKAIDLTSVPLAAAAAPLPPHCVGCHEVPNVGNQSAGQTFATGTSDATAAASLHVSDLPVFTIQCNDPASPLMGQTFNVTDPGRALVTGNCEDIGAVKVPILRGLAARAPYFHNGSAASLADVVEFYDQRFNIGFTEQEKQDLVDFLEAL